MSKENSKVPVIAFKRFQGISDYPKESANGQIPNTYYFGRAINYRDDPQSLTLLPGSVKESGSNVIDLLKWADIVPVTLTSYFIGSNGNFYSRTSSGTWTNLYTLPNNHGNGLAYFSGDDYVYVADDASLSRYGPIQNSPSMTPNFLKAQGGIPMNTASILLASASSMYGHAADSASLSITSDLTLETYFKANSLPAVGSSMTLLGKWDESTNTRSYKLDILGVSGYFGDGASGSLVISSNTTQSLTDSAAIGTAGTQIISATNVSFAAGQVIYIIQMQGTNAGQWERNTINGYTAGTITTATPLLGTYTSGAQVIVVPRYTSITINSGVTWTAKPWNGTTGGLLVYLANSTVTVTGNITASGGAGGYDSSNANGGTGGGFRGGAGRNSVGTVTGIQGESYLGTGGQSTAANGSGGGAAQLSSQPGASAGGGGGNSIAGQNGQVIIGSGALGTGGGTSGSADLTTLLPGGGGGGGAKESINSVGGGGAGGGIIFGVSVGLVVTGTITASGGAGGDGSVNNSGGGGAGGSILLKCQTATLGANLITANGGVGGTGAGAGGAGRIHLDYLTSYTGTTTPTLDFAQDNTLVTSTTYQARLGISNNGTSFEYLTKNLATLTTGVWNRLSVAWSSSISTAQFYLNAVSIGSSVGTKTSISDNASLLYVGADKGASAIGDYFDGLLNDMRIWSNAQTAGQIFSNLNQQVPVASAGLAAYYKFNSAATDATGNTNDLTLVNSPTYSSDVPFSAPSTRLDIDVSQSLTGATYTLLTSITESAVNEIAWTPVNDPQASVGFWVDTKGTGNWTLTVHDQQNRVIATSTIANANIPAAGFVEFIFTTPWRIVAGENYHMHLTVSTGTSIIVTGTGSNFSTAEYTTYFQFLVTDTQFHPLVQFQYQPLGGTLTGAMIIGNERYLAVWDGANFLPNFIQFPPGWHVRCFAYWRNYLAIGMWRGGAITDFDRGRVYFWTGFQPAFDFDIDVPEGQINAMFGVDSDLYMFVGYRGILVDYKGGFFYNTGNSTSNKLKRMPLLAPADYTEVYPSALTMWRGMLHFGLYANSNSTTAQKGIYSFGALNQFYPDTLSYDYVISTGNRGSTVTIGLVYPVGQSLIVGWQDGIAYGADKVNFSNPPASSGELQTLILDNGAVWKPNENLALRADFLALRTGESIDLKFSLDRDDFVVGSIEAIVGDHNAHLPITGGRGKEIQFGVDLYATGSTSPTLLETSLLQNLLETEEQF